MRDYWPFLVNLADLMTYLASYPGVRGEGRPSPRTPGYEANDVS